jgi:hypothetical protein
MTDSKPVPPVRKSRAKAKPAEAVAPAESEPVIPEPQLPEAEPTAQDLLEPVAVSPEPLAVPPAVVAPVPVPAAPVPVPPKNRSNRGIGSLFAVLSGILFTALLAVGTAIIGDVQVGRWSVAFLTDGLFYVPVGVFIIGFVVLVLILNRANWWAYIIGGLLLGAFVYFGTAAVGLLLEGVVTLTPARAAAVYSHTLRDPFVILSALLAREVSVWAGALIASRGRRLRLRNAEAHAQYKNELADSAV